MLNLAASKCSRWRWFCFPISIWRLEITAWSLSNEESGDGKRFARMWNYFFNIDLSSRSHRLTLVISQASLRSHYLAHIRDTSDQAKSNTKLRNVRQHSGKDKKESSFVNFVGVENARMKLATYSATYSGIKSHFLQTLIKFGALSTKMILNYIFRIILKAKLDV